MCIFGLSFGVVFCAVCFANAAEQVSFASNPLWLSVTRTTEGNAVRVSTVVVKNGEGDASGGVTFYANGTSIGSSNFSMPSSVEGVVVAVSFVPTAGTYTISAKITDAEAEIKAKDSLVIEPDNDRDGVADASDDDDDNDGVSDADEKTKGTDPLKKDASSSGASPLSQSAVAGAATTSVSGIIEQAKSIAGPVGETVFETTEGWREKGKGFFDGKVAGNSNVSGFASTTNKDVLKNPMGIWDMVKSYAYKAGAFVFGNVYAFYIFFIILILWIIRKIWRKYSLD